MQIFKRASIPMVIAALVLSIVSVWSDRPAMAAPQSSATNFHFVFAADSRDGYSVLAALSKKMVTVNPLFGFFAGDLCSSFDVNCINNTWKPAMDGNASDGMLTKTFVSRGNHDNGSLAAWQGLWDFQTMAANVGATHFSAQTSDATYSFDYGNSHFAVIDLPGGGSNTWTFAEISWLDSDLAAAEGRGVAHEFIFAHGPMYGVTSEHGGEQPSSALKAVLNKHPISAGFHGHEHITQYTHVTPSIEAGINSYEEFTLGRAGAPPYSVVKYTDWHADQNAFADVAVNGNQFTVTVYSQSGSALFSKTFTDSGSANASWYGSVSISSNRNVVAVARPHIGTEVASYDAFPSGSSTAFLPMLFKNAFGGSYVSAFYVQNTDGSHPAHLTVKYYDSNGTLTCTKPVDTIPPLASHGTWLPSETCLPAGWVGGAVVTSSDYPIVAVARPHVGSEVMTYNAFSSGSTASFLPMLFKHAFGSYNSAFYVQNVDSSHDAKVTIKYYDTNGTLSCTKDVDTIAPLASHGTWLPSEPCLPASWVGGVVVTSDYPIVAVARPHIGTQVTTYDGFASGSLGSYVPMLFKNAFGGSYDSALYIQNVDPDPSHTAHITIDYYDSNGVLFCHKTGEMIASLSSKGYWVPSESCLPVGWVGGAVVTSSDYPIVAVGRPHVGAQVTAYDGFTAGSASMSLPMLFKNMWGSYNSAFYVQNTDPTQAADVTVKFYDVDGNLSCTRTDSIPALATLGYWLPGVSCAP